MVCKAGMALCKVIIAVPTILIGGLIFVILLYSCYANNDTNLRR